MGASGQNHCGAYEGGRNPLKLAVFCVYNQHKCFLCVLLYYLKLYSYVYNDILRGTPHVFPRKEGPDPLILSIISADLSLTLTIP